MRYYLSILFLFCLAFSPSYGQSVLEKTEPPFWYAGMHHNQLQIMFYGKNIADYQVSAPKGVLITEVAKTENPNYQFVTVDTKNLGPSELTFTFISKGKKSFTKKYELKERTSGSALRKGFDSSDMMYLIMPDRFANGNPSNDNTSDTKEKSNRSALSGRHGGDIQGIINNLDYLKNMGVTTIWNTPMCEDNEAEGSYHGYAQTDLYKIDPRFGTNEEYKLLADELHKREMKLVKDYVTNHWGKSHWMIQDLPTYNWIHQFPGYAQSNYRMTSQFDTNASEIDAKYCMDGWFVESMPDLNQSNPLVLNYLIQNAIWWIEYAGLDGLRVDTYSYNDKVGITNWTKAIMDEYPNFNIVGEVWMQNSAHMAYWQKDSKVAAIQSFNSQLPSVMDFTLFNALTQVFHETNPSWDKGMIKVYDNFTNDFLYPDIDNILIFAENHDTPRFFHTYQNPADYKLAMTLLATVRGIPQLYYGSEIGMAGDKNAKGDGDIRRDFPGGWKGDSRNAFTSAGRTALENELYDYTAKVFNWRKSKSVIHKGKTKHFVPQENVYVYFRYNEKESVMVILNNGDKAQEIKPERFQESLGNFTAGKDAISGKTISVKSTISIPAKSAYILELK